MTERNITPEDYDKLSEEEKAEFDRKVEKMLSEPQLQGLVQALPQPEMQMIYGPPPSPPPDAFIDPSMVQVAYGPPVTMNNGGSGIIGFMGINKTMPPVQTCEWIDDTRWRCSCGSENTTKFCPECGAKAPGKPWNCPDCGTHNTGKYCGGCGRPYTENAE